MVTKRPTSILPRDLLAQIEDEALDHENDLASALRKCVALGGRNGSESLRTWATKELKGYDNTDELPSYRTVPAIIALSGQTHNAIIHSQRISPNELPDFTHGDVREQCSFFHPIAELAAIVDHAKGGPVRLSLPYAADLARLMNHQAKDEALLQHINGLFWEVSRASVLGIIDTVRTTLVELVAEMRASIPAGANDFIPSKEAADRAVNVAVNGEQHHVQVIVGNNTGDLSGDADTTNNGENESPQRKVMFWLAAIAGLIVAVAAVWTLGFDAHWWGAAKP